MRAGMQTVAFCEIDPYCRKLLAKHWPEVPIHLDITKLDGSQYAGAIDVICGGYPCQGFSTAGKRRGEEDERYLWPEMRRIIQQARPRWVICENVRGHISLGFDAVAAQLEDDGFTVWPFVIPACAVGAPHRRDRVWIVAHHPGNRRGAGRTGRPDTSGERKSEQALSAMADAQCAERWAGESGRYVPHRPAAERQEAASRVGASSKNGGGKSLADSDGEREQQPSGHQREIRGWLGNGGQAMADTSSQGLPQPEREALCRERRWQEGRAATEYGGGPVKSGVCGGIDGISAGLYADLDCITEAHQLVLTYGNAANRCASEVLHLLRNAIDSQDIQWAFGGSGSISAKEILLTFLCKIEKASRALVDISLQGSQTSEEILRKLWPYSELGGTPYRPRHHQQLLNEYPDSLQALSQLLAYYSQKDWQSCRWQDASTFHVPWADGWEIGTPRVARGVPDRVARLKALGNSVVPQIPQAIGMTIIAWERQQQIATAA
jgi:site-specific DNA-cytosine methylase